MTPVSSAPTGSIATGPVSTSQPVAPSGSAPEDLRKAAQAFEAIFLRQLLASARASDFGGEDLIGGPGLEQFEAMRDEHFADVASQQGVFGLAAAIEWQVAARLPNSASGSGGT